MSVFRSVYSGAFWSVYSVGVFSLGVEVVDLIGRGDGVRRLKTGKPGTGNPGPETTPQPETGNKPEINRK